jgi:hypothetical protein
LLFTVLHLEGAFMPTSALGVIAGVIVLSVLIYFFAGELAGGLIPGVVGGAAVVASYSYFKKKAEK